ncbi:MAG: type III pantothenate kinase [Alloprevotella sp.]
MNLIVDIGNSSAKAAVFDGDTLLLRKRIDGDPEAALRKLADEFDAEACAVAVVGTAPEQLLETLQSLLHRVLLVTGETPTPLVCDYLTPHTLGADRLAAAVGAAVLKPQCNLLIVDVGTCITYDYVNDQGHYLGGNISPGVGIRLRALHEQTAKLPLVEVCSSWPKLGQTTQEAVLAGVMQGIEHEIDGYISQFERACRQTAVFVTGGNGVRFVQHREVLRNDALVEIGLNRILLHHICGAR